MTCIAGLDLPPISDIALYLDPGNLKSYPGDGSTWYDLSGNENHATLNNSPTFSSNFVTFNNTNQTATILANQDSLNFQSEQSIIMWLKNDYTDGVGRHNPWNQAYGGYGTWTHGSSSQPYDLTYYYGNHGGNGEPFSDTCRFPIYKDIWYCLVSTRTNDLIQWYSNGIFMTGEVNRYPYPPISTGNITLANGYAGKWSGQMGQVMAYTRALSADEIAEIYRTTKWRYE